MQDTVFEILQQAHYNLHDSFTHYKDDLIVELTIVKICLYIVDLINASYVKTCH